MSPSDPAAEKDVLLNILEHSDVRLTAQAYIKKIKDRLSLSMSGAKKRLQQLIDEQELSYHYLYGATYVEKNFLKPVRVSSRFILAPPGFTSPLNETDVEIRLEQGISFGSGQHPTTRLCLAAIDFCLFGAPVQNRAKNQVCADIGTGSGVLAMALVRSGLSFCHAYEIDPVSINEARKNIALNRLTKKVIVIEDYFKEQKNKFFIIAANLRFPTLADLSDTLFNSLTENGLAILSGLREWEKQDLVTLYSKKGFTLVWQQDEKNWSGVVLAKLEP